MTRTIILGAIAVAIGAASIPATAADVNHQLNALMDRMIGGNADRLITAMRQQGAAAATHENAVDMQAMFPDIGRLMPQFEMVAPPCGEADSHEDVIIAAKEGPGSVVIDSQDHAGNSISIMQSGPNTYAQVMRSGDLSHSMAMAGEEPATGCPDPR